MENTTNYSNPIVCKLSERGVPNFDICTNAADIFGYSVYVATFMFGYLYIGIYSSGWKRMKKLWRGWVIIPTGVSILTAWQFHRHWKDEQLQNTKGVHKFKITCYRTVPLRAMSRAWGWISSRQVPYSLRWILYGSYSKLYGVNVDEAALPLEHYNSLCEFFTRQLKEGCRPIAQTESVVSPADGSVITAGIVSSCNVEQIKGVTYTIKTFLGEPTWIDAKTRAIENNSATPEFVSNSALTTAQTNAKNLIYKISDGAHSSPYCYWSWTLGFSSIFLCREVGNVLSYNNWMLGWLIFYMRFYIKDLVNSFYFGFHLIYGIRTLGNDKLAHGVNMLRSFNFNVTTPVKNKDSCEEGVETVSTGYQSGDGEDKSGEDEMQVEAFKDVDWGEYKKMLLRDKNNELYQLVVYLAPGDYHRFHSPVTWNVKFRRHFQGELFSVNPKIAKWIPELFSLNERAVYIGNWQHGFFSMIAVGATNVGSIKVYSDPDLETNIRRRRTTPRCKDLAMDQVWSKGSEVGEFRMGSTIVLLFEAPKNFDFSVTHGQKVLVGQPVTNMAEKPSF